MGVRVTAEEEIEGLDIGEHGNEAYPDFAMHSSRFGAPRGTGAPSAVASTAYVTASDYRPERVLS